MIFIDIQCIFHYKLLRQCLRSIIEFLRTPVTRVYQLLFTSSQTISMENLNGKQNLRPEKASVAILLNSSIVRLIQFMWSILDYFFLYLSCALVFPVQRHFEISHAQGFGC